jgi:hypothetical protein
MKKIKQTDNEHHWPRCNSRSVECRNRDLVIRISDWTRQSKDTGEPAYDVECYIRGVYDYNESASFTLHSGLTKAQAKRSAIEFASKQIAKLL